MAKREFQNRNFAAAEKYCQSELIQNPRSLEAIRVMAHVKFESGDYAAAKLALTQLLAFAPPQLDLAPYYALLGAACNQLKDFKGAKVAYARLLERNPNDILALSNLGKRAYADGELKEAKSFAYQFMHELASSAADAAAAKSVDVGRAAYLAAQFATPEVCEEWVECLESFLRQGNTRRYREDKNVHFALGILYEKRELYEKSLSAYREANRLRRIDSKYSLDADAHVLKLARAEFDAGFFARPDRAVVGAGEPAPIFILGMPRSGSSLLEQSLGAHSLVTPQGERSWFSDSFKQTIQAFEKLGKAPLESSDFDADFYQAVRDAYLGKAKPHCQTPYLTDKMPANLRNVWLITRAFPDAMVLCTSRSKLAVVMSCFTNNFEEGQHFTESLEDSSIYFDLSQDLAAHWCRLLPEQVTEVNYEEMVADPRREITRVLQFIGLDVEEACFYPHKQNRQVKTASTLQVVKPIYQTGNERWEAWRPFLGEDAVLFPEDHNHRLAG
jgi:tetratricopeptide (TPR) repeat protein